MNILTAPTRRLRLLLNLIALHSAVVGLGMIWRPSDLTIGSIHP